jgi:hypothetical protein
MRVTENTPMPGGLSCGGYRGADVSAVNELAVAGWPRR